MGTTLSLSLLIILVVIGAYDIGKRCGVNKVDDVVGDTLKMLRRYNDLEPSEMYEHDLQIWIDALGAFSQEYCKRKERL